VEKQKFGEAHMVDKRASLEVIAPSIEEAVAKGLADLSLPEDAVDVEVLDSGSKGVFGLGFRQARVRLTIKDHPEMQPEPERGAAVDMVEAAQPFGLEPSVAEKVKPAIESAPAATSLPQEEKANQVAAKREKDENTELVLQVASQVVEELLDRMKVQAVVTARFGEPDDAHSKTPLLVDVRGDDLSILIGPKAETLNALQYIAGLIISKELGHTVPLVLDVEGFRARRAQQIRQLARRMADQAIKTGRRQVLEPMPASERRLVHIELRDHPQVTTESVGEEPRRKVTIIPK
jgi:spoIIIJ-associated protein